MRSRILKPGFFSNEELGELKPMARLLFAGLWCMADRDGKFEWRPKRIKAKIFPYDTRCEIETYLAMLQEARFIVQYNVNGKQYGIIRKFLDHQNPHPHEKKSKLPDPPDDIEVLSRNVITFNEVSCNANDVSISISNSISKDYTPKFENLWGYYPRKIEKKAAYKKYKATLKAGIDEQDLLKATMNYAKAMAGKEMQHIKHGSTFFGPTEPWREWVEGPPEGFAGEAPQRRAPDPHLDKRCKRCHSWWSTMEKDEEGHCENCQYDLGKLKL